MIMIKERQEKREDWLFEQNTKPIVSSLFPYFANDPNNIS